jgi:alkylation response protein AidB-like acyl-CoA dehydrogenase
VHATFTSEQETIREVAAGLAEGGLEAARAVLDGGPRPAEPTRSILEGFGALGIDEERGGTGGGLVEVSVFVEALARRVVPTPVVGHLAALQAGAAAGIDLPEGIDRRLTTLAVDEPRGKGLGHWSTTVEGTRVTGDKVGVPTDPDTELALVAAADDRLALVPFAAPRNRDSLDGSRPIADVAFDVDAMSVADGATAALSGAIVVAAADLCGVGQGALELASAYARDREQFGRSIGQFQGVAHQLADALVGVEAAWSLTLYAAWAVGEGAPDAARAVHAAKARAGQAAVFAAERGLQVHGGIGATWEADPHLYLRRALGTSAWLGATRWHTIQLGRSLAAA